MTLPGHRIIKGSTLRTVLGQSGISREDFIRAYDIFVITAECRILGGDAVWVRNGEPISFRDTWLDDKASMRRLS